MWGDKDSLVVMPILRGVMIDYDLLATSTAEAKMEHAVINSLQGYIGESIFFKKVISSSAQYCPFPHRMYGAMWARQFQRGS